MCKNIPTTTASTILKSKLIAPSVKDPTNKPKGVIKANAIRTNQAFVFVSFVFINRVIKATATGS